MKQNIFLKIFILKIFIHNSVSVEENANRPKFLRADSRYNKKLGIQGYLPEIFQSEAFEPLNQTFLVSNWSYKKTMQSLKQQADHCNV